MEDLCEERVAQDRSIPDPYCVIEAVERLAENPLPVGYRKLVGATRLYRIRIGKYRIVYEIENDQMVIVIVRVRHRKNAYQNI